MKPADQLGNQSEGERETQITFRLERYDTHNGLEGLRGAISFPFPSASMGFLMSDSVISLE